jgi:antitoxin ParD1/3/4
MNVSLTPRLVNYVREKVDAGLYGSSSEVIRDALRLMETLSLKQPTTTSPIRSTCSTG